jgi:hypothetical protein
MVAAGISAVKVRGCVVLRPCLIGASRGRRSAAKAIAPLLEEQLADTGVMPRSDGQYWRSGGTVATSAGG